MKKIYFLLLALFIFNYVNSQIINFPDANFKAKLIALGHDTDSDGEISQEEAFNTYSLDISSSNISDLTGLDFFLNIHSFVCNENFISEINLYGLSELYSVTCHNNINLASMNINDCDSLSILSIINNNQLINFNISNLPSLYGLFIPNNKLLSLNLSDFPVLMDVDCRNNQLTNLIVSNLPQLHDLYAQNNQLTNLIVSNLPRLSFLECDNNQLTSLNLSNLPLLKELTSDYNQLSSLIVSNLPELYRLSISNNQLTSLNISNLTRLESLNCNNNLLSSLDLSEVQNFPRNLRLNCKSNLLTTINLQNVLLNMDFDCSNNLLTSIEIPDLNGGPSLNCNFNPNLNSIIYKNPSNSFYMDFNGCPHLEYVCVAENKIEETNSMCNLYGYNNVVVNSYCSFTPGGQFYNIQGNSKFDENNNGCDASDVALSNQKFNITNGSIIGSLIANTSGNYSIPVQAGTHTITPVFENPTYFTVSPASASITFPTQMSPFTQNFCVTANGVHPDLEVTILPLSPARPGFDATYKLVYKNKGNTTQFGTVNVVFNDALLDFVVANPVVTSQTVNNLSWNFTNLLPFETREITFTLNVNSPMEIPAVNNGDVLNYTATVSPVATDDMPNDNTFVFNQTVVNSYDPNDKTCLEGATISPAKVGDYVHYMIRFENNGTANAQNIVVKDMIDLAKFDINSLVPIKGSHSFVTNISAGNKVEFIFENINLPFDDANNDGYVSFKIKTKPTLTNGDTFSNSASIYFDYNFPIVTNTATTTIQALSRQDFEFSNYFKLYPNPVNSTLNIDAKDTIEISSINIYNTLGQLVLVVSNAQNIKMVDVSNLSSGNYFIKINSDKGTSNTKFIKQ